MRIIPPIMSVAFLSSGMTLELLLRFVLEQCRDLAAARHPGKAEMFCFIPVFQRPDRAMRFLFSTDPTQEG